MVLAYSYFVSALLASLNKHSLSDIFRGSKDIDERQSTVHPLGTLASSTRAADWPELVANR
jgi:hypothetical protein